MWPGRYWAARYWNARYWAKVGDTPATVTWLVGTRLLMTGVGQ